jgi:hypothetical protein
MIQARSTKKSRGTVLRATAEIKFDELADFVNRDSEFRVETMYQIGRSARKYLINSGWLSTRSPFSLLKFKGFKKNKRGTWKIRNVVMKGGHKVVFTSPPLNLFEFGRTYRGTSTIPNAHVSRFARKRYVTEPGRHILTGRFKDYLERNVSRLANIGMQIALNNMKKKRGLS